MKELKINIEKCIHLLKGFNINYNTMVGPRTCALVNQINVLLPYIRTKYPKISDILNEANNEINHNGFINAYAIIGKTKCEQLQKRNVYFLSKTKCDLKSILTALKGIDEIPFLLVNPQL